jgi:hypothetical protein
MRFDHILISWNLAYFLGNRSVLCLVLLLSRKTFRGLGHLPWATGLCFFCIYPPSSKVNRSQWPRGLRRRSAAARLLRLWVRIPPGAWIFVCYEWCVLSGRGLCDELITRPEESYRLWCVVVCDLETPRMKRPWPNGGCCAKNKQTNWQHAFERAWGSSNNVSLISVWF